MYVDTLVLSSASAATAFDACAVMHISGVHEVESICLTGP